MFFFQLKFPQSGREAAEKRIYSEGVSFRCYGQTSLTVLCRAADHRAAIAAHLEQKILDSLSVPRRYFADVFPDIASAGILTERYKPRFITSFTAAGQWQIFTTLSPLIPVAVPHQNRYSGEIISHCSNLKDSDLVIRLVP